MKSQRTFTTGGKFKVVHEAVRSPRCEPNTSSEARELPGPRIEGTAEPDTLETARAVNPQTTKE
jgi:hypothetical protein